MDLRHIKIVVPAPIEPPRGAAWAADAVVWTWRQVQRLAGALRPTAPAQRQRQAPTRRRRAA